LCQFKQTRAVVALWNLTRTGLFVDLLRTCAFERGSWRSICSAKAMCTLAGSTGLLEGLLCAVDE
jgi:hypothetical protein